MPIITLYHNWNMRIRQFRPTERITRIRNITWLIAGIYQSRSVCLSRIAGKIPTSAKLLSTTRRLSRLLSNPAIRVREWYEPIARQWLEAQYHNRGEIRLIVDGTKVGFGHQLLIVSLAYRKRAIPIAWTWVKHVKGHSTARKQLALLAYVHTLLPLGAAVFLVGDSEFGSVAILRQLDRWHWFYVLRQKADTGVWFNEQSGWKAFGSYIQKPGQLTLAVAILYVWLVSVGTRTIRSGLRHLVDRTDRRDLSIFQIGLHFVDRCLINAFPYNIRLCSYR
jgi:hypothetical protein